MADMAAQIQLLIDLTNAQTTAAAASLAATQAATDAAAAAAAAALAAGAPGAPPHAPVPAAAPYAILPGIAITDVLDYSKPTDRKIYSTATAPLSTLFDLSSENLQVFLEKIGERASVYNWDSILTIPDDDGDDQHLIENFGLLTLQNCIEEAEQYIDQETREAQDSAMMFMFLKASITDEARMMIMPHVGEYTILGKPSGTCLLKVLIGKSTVDTVATVHILRKSMANLDNKMIELNSDVKAFNQYVSQLRRSLYARGEKTPELMMNLFEAYAKAGDEDFVRYIRNIQDGNDDGRQPVSVETLMMLAINKYELSMTHGSWTLTETKDAQIIALKAELEKKASGKRRAVTNDNRFAWKIIPPGEGEKRVRMWNKKKYFWCPKHKAWTIHTPESCNIKNSDQQVKPTTEPTPPSPASSTSEHQGLYLNRAYQAIQEEEDESDM